MLGFLYMRLLFITILFHGGLVECHSSNMCFKHNVEHRMSDNWI